MSRETPSTIPDRRGPATVRDVAAYAGVSTATVSRVLNGVVTVEPTLVDRVLAACAALRYEPNRAARTLRGGRSVMVGLLVPNIRTSFFMEVVSGVEEVLHHDGYLPILCNYLDKQGPLQFVKFIEHLVAVPLAGAIVVPRHDQDPALTLFREHRIPIVAIDHRSLDESDSVLIDNVGAAREAVAHLIANGYRRIGLIAGPDKLTTGRQRAQGYRAALEEAGIACDPALERRGTFKEHTGEASAIGLLDLQPPVEALFTTNVSLTMGALRVLHQRGLRVPEDVALVGFDEIPSLLPSDPSITTVVQPAFEMGATAARRLIQRLEGEGPHTRQEIMLAHQLRIGDSSRARAPVVNRAAV
jgi:DNA-binding LacI/PurR family transcriptional regulator